MLVISMDSEEGIFVVHEEGLVQPCDDILLQEVCSSLTGVSLVISTHEIKKHS